MHELKLWLADNWTMIVGFLGSTLASGYVVLKKFLKLERDLEELKKDFKEHQEDDHKVQEEIKADLKEIRQDIKQLLSRGK